MYIRQSLHPHPRKRACTKKLPLICFAIYLQNKQCYTYIEEAIILFRLLYYFHLHVKVEALVATTMVAICIAFLMAITKTDKACYVCQVIDTGDWKWISIKMLLSKQNLLQSHWCLCVISLAKFLLHHPLKFSNSMHHCTDEPYHTFSKCFAQVFFIYLWCNFSVNTVRMLRFIWI